MSDDELRKGWAWSTVGEVGLVQLGRQRSPKNHLGANMRPYLRVANVFEDRIDTSDVMSMNFTPEEYSRYRLEVGDILLNEGQSPELLGRPAMYRGDPPDVCFTNSLIRFRAHEGIEPGWALLVFRHHMHSLRFMRESQITTNIAHLSAGRLKPVEFPVPPSEEQRRIVEAVEAAFSKLDAGVSYIATAKARLHRLRDQMLQLPWSGDAPLVELGKVLTQPLANGRSVRSRTGGFPVLRLTAIRGGIVQIGERKEGDWTAEEARNWLIASGDFLISRGNGSLSLVGRGALVVDEPDPVAFPDTLIRARVDPTLCDARYLALVWNTPMNRQAIEALARTTAGIYKVNQSMLERIEIPMPSLDEQRRLVSKIEDEISLLDGLSHELDVQLIRSRSLGRSILTSAVSGELALQNPADEPASALLERLAPSSVPQDARMSAKHRSLSNRSATK